MTDTRPIAATAHLLLLTTTVFALICGAAQFWRHDLDPIAIPLSFYLTGPGGAYVRLAYYLISAGLLGFALGGYRATSPQLRSRLASALFAGAGLALPIVALTEQFLGSPHEQQARLIHGLAAQATFLWLSFGMLLLNARWRRDTVLSAGSTTGWIVAWLATAVLWSQVFLRDLPHGLMQKLTIGLILVWLAWAARHMRRAAGVR
ncbi:DUF998 domain-containing protein [Dyella sp. LX-66]|uniref:DUF998 domain-containing protein n=1 Tax=unclassified Dyella TaxID=2634549 RepID=UPI001BDF7A76|nr:MULTISPECIES: DUF998 domain-containing protein [unclassified Dyella]MBT2116825.1 DUF998 domain-containing protein [Dyella sp. LX-1]MBT2138995.1 DUF998 domain-containing protein [Dyella sp. LX-66]